MALEGRDATVRMVFWTVPTAISLVLWGALGMICDSVDCR